jgi:hypothetical protein
MIILAKIPTPKIIIISGARVMIGITCDTIMGGITNSKNFLKYKPISIIPNAHIVASRRPIRDSKNVTADAVKSESTFARK